MNCRRSLIVAALLLCCTTVLAANSTNIDVDGIPGKQRWSFSTKRGIVASPALSPDEMAIYVASLDGNLYAVRADHEPGDTVEPDWTLKLGGPLFSSPIVAEDGTIYI